MEVQYRAASQADRMAIAKTIAYSFERDFSALCKDMEKIALILESGIDINRFVIAEQNGETVGVTACADCTGRAAIPSHLFRMMAEMEKSENGEKAPFVYAIVNNGFYEGKQNHIALDIMKNWCVRAGLRYGQGIGQGAGEMMGFVDTVPLGHGPLKNLGEAIKDLARNIEACKGGEDVLFSPNWPRFAWRIQATHLYWH